MSSHTYNVHDAKSQLSKLLQEALDGKDVIISRANKPLVRLVPLTPLKPDKRVFGQNLGGITFIADDFDAPLEFPSLADPLDSPVKVKARRSGRARTVAA